MPEKNGRFTEKEIAFTAHMADVANPVIAAALAGYSHPNSAATRAMRNPALMAEVQRRQRERLFNECLPAAVNLLHKVLMDDKENTRNRIAAAKIVLDRTLGAADAAADAKEPHEMTAEELAGRIARLRQRQLELAGQAVDVTPAEEQIEGPEPEPFG